MRRRPGPRNGGQTHKRDRRRGDGTIHEIVNGLMQGSSEQETIPHNYPFDPKGAPRVRARRRRGAPGASEGAKNVMSGQESEASQDRILTIQKSPWRAFRHLQTLGRAGGVAVFSAVFYLLYWKDSSIAQQHETFFWWLAFRRMAPQRAIESPVS